MAQRGRPRQKSGRRRGFALRFYKARKHLGMTQKQAAEQLGVSLPTVGRWEIGEFEPRGLARKFVDQWIKRAMQGGKDG